MKIGRSFVEFPLLLSVAALKNIVSFIGGDTAMLVGGDVLHLLSVFVYIENLWVDLCLICPNIHR